MGYINHPDFPTKYPSSIIFINFRYDLKISPFGKLKGVSANQFFGGNQYFVAGEINVGRSQKFDGNPLLRYINKTVSTFVERPDVKEIEASILGLIHFSTLSKYIMSPVS